MTHQPPIPQAAQSPYPLHPGPHNDNGDAPAAARPRSEDRGAALDAPPAAYLIGIGAALLGSVALAAWYYRRSAPAAPVAKTARRRGNAAEQPYGASYFARKHGLTLADAREIIAEAGSDREKANALANQRRD